jgi:2,5-diamino-6-(ribosylamino)-4(3H)-pyrimidinone 5'-phosphate reductase
MLPRVVLHNEMSADGRLDWFTPHMGLYYELAGRWKAEAMLSGSNTLLHAYPEDTLREEDADALEPPSPDPDDDRPLLVVVDSRGRLRNWHLLRQEPYWRDVVVLCSRATPSAYLETLRQRRVECILAGDQRVDLRAALEELHAHYGVSVVRVDSGGVLNGALLRAGLVDEVSVLVSPSLVGGTTARSIFVAPDLTSAEGVIPLRLTHVEQPEDDLVWLRYDVIR